MRPFPKPLASRSSSLSQPIPIEDVIASVMEVDVEMESVPAPPLMTLRRFGRPFIRLRLTSKCSSASSPSTSSDCLPTGPALKFNVAVGGRGGGDKDGSGGSGGGSLGIAGSESIVDGDVAGPLDFFFLEVVGMDVCVEVGFGKSDADVAEGVRPAPLTGSSCPEIDWTCVCVGVIEAFFCSVGMAPFASLSPIPLTDPNPSATPLTPLAPFRPFLFFGDPPAIPVGVRLGSGTVVHAMSMIVRLTYQVLRLGSL